MFSSFILGTINQVTMAASLRRSNVYSIGATDKDKKKFRVGMCAELRKIAKQYNKPVSDIAHLKNIRSLKAYAESNHESILKGKTLNFGIVQKALNLYLKLLWSQGNINEPPHCPLDAIIIKKLPKEHHCNWTKLSDEKIYVKLIQEIKVIASKRKLSVARWELVAYHE